jgi:hypothetical protein
MIIVQNERIYSFIDQSIYSDLMVHIYFFARLRHGKIYALRKEYNERREEVLEDIEAPTLKSQALVQLDNINSILMMLEEQKMPWLQRRRMKKQVKYGLRKVKLLLKEEDELD